MPPRWQPEPPKEKPTWRPWNRAEATGGTGTGGGTTRDRDVLEHAADVRKRITGKAAEERRKQQEKEQADWNNALCHKVLDFLANND